MDGVDNMVNPFTISGKVENPNVLNRLTSLGKSMTMPPEKMADGSVNLTDRELFNDRQLPNGQYQSPYDRWLELIGQTDLKKQLTAFVQSEEFTQNSKDMNITMAAAIVKRAQDQAFAMMLDEYTQVAQALGQAEQVRKASVKGGPEAVKQVLGDYSKIFVKQKYRPDPSMPE
jgi:hypothetical protein